MDAASFDLRSLSNGSFGSWRALQGGLAGGASSPLLDYFGQLAASRWDLSALNPNGLNPATLAALAHTARLSSSGAANGPLLRAGAAAAAAEAASLGGGSAPATADRSNEAAGPPPLLASKRRTVLAAWQPEATGSPAVVVAQAAANTEGEDAPQRRFSPQGRLTPEALLQGAAAAEGLLTSQACF